MSNVFFITPKKLLNLSIYCNKKLVIEGNIFSSSPTKCSGMTDRYIGSGNIENIAIVYKVLSSIDTLLPPFGSSNWIQFIALLDYCIMKDKLALGCKPKT